MPGESPARHDGGRTLALDGLRGLAAASVVLGHSFASSAMTLVERSAWFRHPASLLIHAQGAVQVFFVLSGYVLAASLTRSRERAPWPSFYTRRVLRIHPPYAFGVLFAWVCSAAWVAVPGAKLAPWFPGELAVRANASQVLASLSFPGTGAGLLPIGWTLKVEMIFSLLLPILALLARPWSGLPLLLGCSALLLLPVRDPWWYALDFAIGVVAFLQRDTIGRWIHSLPGVARNALPLLGACVLCLPLWLGWSQIIGTFVLPGFRSRDVAVMAVGAGLLVVGAVWVPPFVALLTRPAVLALGRVSYSLYLVHYTVIKLALPRLLAAHPETPWPVAAAVMLALSIVVAIPSYHLIERPSLAAGARLSRRIAARFPRLRAEPDRAPESA